jgi:SHS2 domain-containing protein
MPLETSVSFRWIEHTGEIELELEAASERGIFEAGFLAMRELMSSTESPERIEAPVALTGEDRAVLLADWLGELAFLGETRGLVPTDLASFELTADGLTAVVEGSEGDPPHLVKGATYHRLGFERTETGWHARVVLDV